VKPLASAVLFTGAVLTGVFVTGCAHGTPATKPPAVPSHGSIAAETTRGGCPSSASLPLPEEFPATLPVPEGATITSVERRSGNRLIVNSVVHGGFPAVLSFMQHRLPKAGYAPSQGEVEKDDAESNFSSATVVGRWALRTVPGCPGGVYLTYLTSPKP
jgi:hypothetical protein